MASIALIDALDDLVFLRRIRWPALEVGERCSQVDRGSDRTYLERPVDEDGGKTAHCERRDAGAGESATTSAHVEVSSLHVFMRMCLVALTIAPNAPI